MDYLRTSICDINPMLRVLLRWLLHPVSRAFISSVGDTLLRSDVRSLQTLRALETKATDTGEDAS